jgi:hypothetical protein
MDGLSHYESRTGILSCSPEELFDFVTEIRNFEQFIPQGSVSNWTTGIDTCSFSVSMIGTVTVRITRKEPFSKVIYSGDAMKKNDFSLELLISSGHENNAGVKVLLAADLNPMLKMVANQPIRQFLDILIREMENFRGWKNIIK